MPYGQTRDFARRGSERRITAHAVVPGFAADTEFLGAGGCGDSAAMVEGAARQKLMGRIDKPDDFTARAEWPLSPHARWAIGPTISVNGGGWPT